MKSTKLKKFILCSCLAALAVCAILWLAVSQAARPKAPEGSGQTEGGLPVIAPAEQKITPSKDGVEEFLEKNEYLPAGYDDCYNITPDFVADNFDIAIFKVNSPEQREEIFIVDRKTYGFPVRVVSMALADVDQDGLYELYYSYIFGSGILRCGLGYFDPNRKENVPLGREFQWDKLFTTNEAGELCVNESDWEWNDPNDEGNFDAEYSICAGEQVGTILLEDGEITLKIDPEYEDDMW